MPTEKQQEQKTVLASIVELFKTAFKTGESMTKTDEMAKPKIILQIDKIVTTHIGQLEHNLNRKFNKLETDISGVKTDVNSMRTEFDNKLETIIKKIDQLNTPPSP